MPPLYSVTASPLMTQVVAMSTPLMKLGVGPKLSAAKVKAPAVYRAPDKLPSLALVKLLALTGGAMMESIPAKPPMSVALPSKPSATGASLTVTEIAVSRAR